MIVQPIQTNLISFKKSKPNSQNPIENSVAIHSKLIRNGFSENVQSNKTRMEFLYSELDEFKKAVKEGNRKNMEEEIGDVIFDAVLLADYYDIDPVKALNKANNKIDTRIKLAQSYAEKPLTEYPFDVRMIFWEMAKKEIQQKEILGLDTFI